MCHHQVLPMIMFDALKGLVRRRVSIFFTNCLEKKFAIKCYEAVVNTSMNLYLYEKKKTQLMFICLFNPL